MVHTLVAGLYESCITPSIVLYLNIILRTEYTSGISLTLVDPTKKRYLYVDEDCTV